MAQKTRKSTKKRSRKILGILKYSVLVLLLFFLLGAGATSGFVAALVKEDPVRTPDEIKSQVYKNDLTGFAYFSNVTDSNDHELIGMLRAAEDRRFIQFDDIPQNVKNAFLAIEDRAFYDHIGVNFKSLSRAVLQQVLNSDVQTGGSTITQQLAKNTFYSLDRTFSRKAKEIFLALRMERILTKDQILTAYINKINYGKAANLNNVYGIQAAAKGYFNKDAKDLNLAEAAYLAGIPQRPTGYSAFTSTGFNEERYEAAKARQEQVLNAMLVENFITENEYQNALTYDIKAAFESSEEKAYDDYPFLMMEIENRAAEKLLESQGITKDSEDYSLQLDNAKLELQTGGYKVYTTIDKNIYEAMNDVARNSTTFAPPKDYDITLQNGSPIKVENAIEQIGATLIDNKSGAIIGFVGGRDFDISQVNHSNFRGVPNKRQPGSSVKPILVYGPALELGKIQPATPIDDTPLNLFDGWEPENWNLKYNGRISARYALKWSFNIPAVKIYQMVGRNTGYDFYTKMGFKVDKKAFLNAGLSPSIGTLGTSPEEMTRAFTTFANGGTYNGSYLIDHIEDKDGNVIYEHKSNPTVVFNEQTTWLLTDMLRSVVTSGTGTKVKKYLDGRDLAAKTGTTNDQKDLWFVGYTPDITMGVWVGYDMPYRVDNYALATEMWGEIFKKVNETDPNLSPAGSTFIQPPGLVKMEVSSTSGKLPTDLTKEAGYLISDWFNKDFIPTEMDDSLEKARVVYYNGERYIAKDETPDDMVQTGIFYKRDPYELPYQKDQETGETKVDDNGEPILKDPPIDYNKELPNEVDPRDPTIDPPQAPTNVILKLQGTKNVLSWDKLTDENIVGYRIYRASIDTFSFSEIGVKLQKDLESEENRIYYEDPVDSNNPYVYYITAVDVSGLESVQSELRGNTDTTPFDLNLGKEVPPSAPKRLTANVSGLNVTLVWEKNKEGDQVTNYKVYRSTEKDGDYSLVSQPTEPTHSEILPILGQSVYYYVTAVNENGESKPSNIIKANNH